MHDSSPFLQSQRLPLRSVTGWIASLRGTSVRPNELQMSTLGHEPQRAQSVRLGRQMLR